MTHLVFFDGECGLCDFVVKFILKHDRKKVFLFAPLQGTTAKNKLKELDEKVKQADSLILIENFGTANEKVLLFGKGALRIAWYLGGIFTPLGALSFLPSAPFDFLYRIVARNRKKIFGETCTLPTKETESRFLD